MIDDDIDDFESGFNSTDHPSKGDRFRSALDSLRGTVLHKNTTQPDTQQAPQPKTPQGGSQQQQQQEEEEQESAEPPSEYDVFGMPLEDAIDATGSTILGVPDIVVYCVSYVLRFGMEEEGIFRLSGSLTEVNKIKDMFQRGKIPSFDVTGDPNVITGLLKQYLRALPSPIFKKEQNVESSGNMYRDVFDAINEAYKPTAVLLLNLFSEVKITSRIKVTFIFLCFFLFLFYRSLRIAKLQR